MTTVADPFTVTDQPLWDAPDPDQPPTDQPGPGPDPEAPYGRDRNGKAYKMSPEERAELSERLRRGREATGNRGGRRAAPRASGRRASAAGPGSAKKPPPGPNYFDTVQGLLTIPAFLLGIAGRLDPAFTLDSAALTLHGPTVAAAIAQVAADNANVARVLDKAAQVGPYGALFAALMPLAVQIAANHKIIPPNADLGILPPDVLMDRLDPDGRPSDN